MNDHGESKVLLAAESGALATLDPARPFGRAIVVPKLVADAGERAAKRFANFFGSIENDNTRAAYQRACAMFFAWCDSRDLALADIEPIHVGAYVKILGEKFEKPTVKQHLAAIKMLFDWLVVGQAVVMNPAHPVRGPKHVVKRGKTPVLTADQARELLDSAGSNETPGFDT
jgi:site-specific recombinase XerD